MFPNRTTCSVNWQSVESVNRTVCPSDVYTNAQRLLGYL